MMTPVSGIVAQAGLLLANELIETITPATRIVHSGQIAYVEPQSCCERKAPCAVAINTIGKTKDVPLRLLKLSIADTNDAISMNGQRARRRSALSDGSRSMSK